MFKIIILLILLIIIIFNKSYIRSIFLYLTILIILSITYYNCHAHFIAIINVLTNMSILFTLIILSLHNSNNYSIKFNKYYTVILFFMILLLYVYYKILYCTQYFNFIDYKIIHNINYIIFYNDVKEKLGEIMMSDYILITELLSMIILSYMIVLYNRFSGNITKNI